VKLIWVQPVKTDTIFYELIRELPQVFFQLIGKPESNPNAYRFIAQEVKQQSFRLDGIFSTVEGFENKPLYFVEFQTYKDDEFYERLFGEIFVYFRQYVPPNEEWYAIVIYDRRSNETPFHPRYQILMDSYVHRIYLNELSNNDNNPLEIGIAKLFVETPRKAPTLAQKLIDKAKIEIRDERIKEKMLAFIQGIVFYKFPNLTIQDIETMLDLSEFQKSTLYQSVQKKTKLDIVPKLLEQGLSVQQIAEALELDVEEVRKIAKG
jgi:predicted transposase/invertase (TIGR01784 family)